jgi:hypothetical protein
MLISTQNRSGLSAAAGGWQLVAVDSRSTPAGAPFRLACGQRHVQPDPKRHIAKEWPQVVARMRESMEQMNRVVGSVSIAEGRNCELIRLTAFVQNTHEQQATD